jgi:hypothetical protein
MSARWPQPREGITGTLHDPPGILSLEEDAVEVRRALMGATRCLMRATLVGNPAPVVARMSTRMRDPQPGDLVMETSSTCRLQAEDFCRAFGILLAHRTEWWTTDAEWEQSVAGERAAHKEFLRGPYAIPGDRDEPWEPDERMTDHAWYVQYGPQPQDVCRWVNCEFAAVPADPHFAEVPFGTQAGNGVTVNRGDVVGALADSGFRLRENH